MTYGPPERNDNPQQPDPRYPQHLWPDYAQPPGSPGRQQQAQAKSTALLGVLAFVLGLAALVVPFLPVDMSGFRQYVAFPFALPGIGLAIAGLIGSRRGKPLAVVGLMLCALALGVGAILLWNHR